MTPSDCAKELLRRRKARTSLIDFICYNNPDYIVCDFHREVCAALEQFYIDYKNLERPVLIIQAPPQFGKSEIVSRNFPAWVFGDDPNLTIAGFSYGMDLASDVNRDLQRIMMSHEYSMLFPNSTLNKKRVVTVDLEPKRNSETFELVGAKGRYVARGVGGSITGKPVSIGIIDDPIKNAQQALSETVKQSISAWYDSTFSTRFSNKGGIIAMMTRWAEDDLAGMLIQRYPRARVLKFKALSDDGKSLFPQRHSAEKLFEQKAVMSSYFWEAQYQQSPTKLGGNIIKGEWFKFYACDETRIDEKSNPHINPEKHLLPMPMLTHRCIYADTANKTGRQNDYSVFQCWGLGIDGNAYLIDQIRDKWEAPELERRAILFWQKHEAMDPEQFGRLRSMNVEDAASGTGLIQKIKKDGKFPINAIKRNVDKYTRLLDIVGYIEAGKVFLPSGAPFLNDLIGECEAFSADGSHQHDDQIDPLVDAIREMLSGPKYRGSYL